MGIDFSYFYGQEADQYSFYRIPRALFTNECFKGLSSDSKILYGLMLDRMAMSVKNHWFDEENRAYIYFSVEDVMEYLNCGRNKAVKTLQELDSESGIGLIEKRRQGMGKPSIIYVKSFLIQEEQMKTPEELPGEEQSGDTAASEEVYKTNSKKFKKQTSRSLKSKLQEVYKTNSNYNNNNYNKESYNKSNLIVSGNLGCDDDAMQEHIRDQIDYGSLITVHPDSRDIIDGIVDLITETVLLDSETILIASNWYPRNVVRSKFLKLNYQHISYVLSCLRKSTSKVINTKKYLLAALFNAPTTMGAHYQAAVNHDMPQFAI